LRSDLSLKNSFTLANSVFIVVRELGHQEPQ
jgi:hypothetical protein